MRAIIVVFGVLALSCAVFAAEIHDAARLGKIDSVKIMLAAKPELINSRNETEATPLHSAAYNGQTEVAEYLLSAGADINALTNSGSTPLHGAAFYGHLEAAKLLIVHGANLNVANRAGYVPLLGAAVAGHIDIVKALIEAGADTSVRVNEGRLNALMLAAFGGHQDVVEYLITKGFDLKQVTDTGENFLHVAADSDSLKMVRMGLDQGIDPNSTNNYGETPLHQAVISLFRREMTSQKAEIIKALLAGGADIDCRDTAGNSPLIYAVQSGKSEAVSLLITAGANVSNINNDGITPLVRAIENGNLEIVSMLLQNGAITETWEKHYGLSPLHMAVLYGDIEVLRRLLDYAEDINIEDAARRTPLDMARKYGHKQIADLLKSKGGKGSGFVKSSGSLGSLKISPKEGKADLWYLGHCGWAIRTKSHLMIFDYFPGAFHPANPSLTNGNINPDEIKNLNVEVFVTHAHPDHYDSTIYSWQPAIKNLTYIFGFRPEQLPEDQKHGYAGQPYEYIGPRETRNLDGMRISTIASNDGGVGFLVVTDGLKIFHAGDHAGWANGDSLPYTSEIDYLATSAGKVDMAFINTTGCRFSLDTLALQQSVFYAIEKLSPAVTIPTHGGGREYVYRDYAGKIKEKGYKTNVLCADFRGDHFAYTKSGASF
jgi:ankyrin repeat protein